MCSSECSSISRNSAASACNCASLGQCAAVGFSVDAAGESLNAGGVVSQLGLDWSSGFASGIEIMNRVPPKSGGGRDPRAELACDASLNAATVADGVRREDGGVTGQGSSSHRASRDRRSSSSTRSMSSALDLKRAIGDSTNTNDTACPISFPRSGEEDEVGASIGPFAAELAAAFSGAVAASPNLKRRGGGGGGLPRAFFFAAAAFIDETNASSAAAFSAADLLAKEAVFLGAGVAGRGSSQRSNTTSSSSSTFMSI